MWQRTKLKLGHRCIWVDYKHCVEYCTYDFANFNSLCLTRNTSCRPILNKLNLFLIFVLFKIWKNSLELHIFKISFEKFSNGNPLTLAFNTACIREIIVVQLCKRALHILYGKLPIHNSDNTLDLLYDMSGPAYNPSATTAKKWSSLLCIGCSLYLCTNVWRKFFINHENKSNNKKKNLLKSLAYNMHRF